MCCVPLTPTDDRPMNAISRVVRLGKSVAMCGCRDGRVFIVDLDRSELIRLFRAHRSWISAMDVDSLGHCVMGSYDTTVSLYTVDPGRQKLVFSFMGHKDYVTAVCLAENWFFTASSDHTAYQISLDTSHQVAAQISTHSTVHVMRALQTDERFLLMGYADGVVELRQYDNFEVVKVEAKVARKDKDGKRVKEVVDGKKVTVYEEVKKTIKKDKPSRLNARRKLLSVLYPVTEVPADN